MRSVSDGSARQPRLAAIAAALRGFAAECVALAACLMLYVGALAAIAGAAALFVTRWNFDDRLAALHLDDLLPEISQPREGWRPDPSAAPAFAVSQFDMGGITATYEVYRDGDDGRRDVLRWTDGATQVAGLRIDRPGPALTTSATVAALIEAGFRLDTVAGAQAAGVVETKFGPVKLLGLPDRAGAAAPCLGFAKTFAHPDLRFEGWSCQGETVAARRAAITCLLDRLVLLKSGHDAALAELFARAELRRADCGGAAPRRAGDWIVSAQDPRLRGPL
ncbi:MAG: hypothetical protein M9932_18280 [Xanthobacteraceae bacterium]|nr:hypothetical protein [Xanthobacteraceae bacterium]